MVYDITRRQTFNHLEAWLTDATNHASPNTVIFLIGNKADLEDQVSCSNCTYNFLSWPMNILFREMFQRRKLGNLHESTDFTFVKPQVKYISWPPKTKVTLSAKTGENVEEAFLETARQIYQKIQEGSLELNAADSGVQTRQQETILFFFIFQPHD